MAVQLSRRFLRRIVSITTSPSNNLHPQTHGDVLVRGASPLLEVTELLEAEELAELVHRADTPRAALHDAHDLDDAEDGGVPARAVRRRGCVRRVLEDVRDVVVGERAVRAALQTAKGARPRVGVQRAPRAPESSAGIAQL